ncbi:Versicolorin B synthase [Tolypocladium ophioglossoides CBS 100239]|uniref:Versicolorin B synthase n=1 Tax=Tolypocladium ophioglossoides (strain CBS 100239) TaxID=1163406 RepID=A0A0L0MWJ0_TOLOC|nr:Versicolorin B synthase [Tolypocladium ophioglossoides CBS 100239]
MASEGYDYIIVGGGTAGLVLAARLSEDAASQVLVIEAGEDQTADPRITVPALWPTLLNTSADWRFQTVPQLRPNGDPDKGQDGLGGREIVVPQGRLLGGSSAINGLLFTPTSKANVDAWTKLGNAGWDWTSFAKSLSKSYSLNAPSEAAKAGGPIQLSFPDDSDNIWPKAWADTLGGLGLPVNGDSFSGQAYGALTNPDCIHAGTKQRNYAGNAYLEPARARENLTVLTQAAVDKIVFSKSSPEPVAEAVQYTKGGETKTVAARKDIVLAAGAINSPRLLELSGVGGAELLKKLGVEVIVDNPNVGENLQNHVMCCLSFEAREGLQTMDALARQDPAAITAATEAYGKQSGPFASSGTNASAQLPLPGIRTAEGRADLEQMLGRCAADAAGDGCASSPAAAAFAEAHNAFVRSVLASPEEASGCYISFPGYASFNADGSMGPPPPGAETYFSTALLLAHPLSRGSVHATSASSSASASGLAINPRYLSHPLDIEVLARHLRFLEVVAAAEPLASLLKAGGKRNASAPAAGAFADLEQAKDYVRRTAVGAHHFTGTCSMMARELGGVVDSQLRVYGCRNLRVCDASIIPLTPRANPQATVYGVAEHAADMIKSGL